MEQPQGKNGNFSTSLLGFKKDEVLTYIDWLSAENQRRAQEHSQQADQLQQIIDQLRRENDEILSRTQQVCQELQAERSIPSRPASRLPIFPNSCRTPKKAPGISRPACSTGSRRPLCSGATTPG